MADLLTIDDLKTSLVTISIGKAPKATELTVHESLIRKILFLEKALSCGMSETHTRTIPLPEDDEAVVLDAIRWLYNGCPEYYKQEHLTCEGRAYRHKASIWVLADKWQCTKLQNAIMRNIHDQHVRGTKDKGPVDYDMVADIISEVACESALGRFLIDATVWELTLGIRSKESRIEEALEKVDDVEFAAKVAGRLARKCFSTQPDCVPIEWDHSIEEYLVKEDDASESSASSDECRTEPVVV